KRKCKHAEKVVLRSVVLRLVKVCVGSIDVHARGILARIQDSCNLFEVGYLGTDSFSYTWPRGPHLFIPVTPDHWLIDAVYPICIGVKSIVCAFIIHVQANRKASCNTQRES